ncbi:hypothetical protein ACFLTS_06650 [Chloroflexota bacterium]
MRHYSVSVMRKYCLLLLVVAALIWSVAGCGGDDEVKARLGQEFSLRIGQTAAIAGEDLRISFDEVTEDSRCPRNVTCIWEGRVSCVVQVIEGGSPHALLLTEYGTGDQNARENYGEYQIAFHVEPYPEEADGIPDHEYELLLTVDK